MNTISAIRSNAIQPVDPIWDSVRREAGEAIDNDPLLAAFLYSTVLNQASLEEAVARLLRTGRFEDVSYEIDEAGRGVFRVVERPLVKEIRFEGVKIFRESTLRTEIPQKIGEPLNLSALREGRDAILRKYHEVGNADADVTVDEPAARIS